ncbi:MAG TPA: ATP-binding protein [Candidatus Binataceae bacterium]|nr:ATP-binding protein [Candidatus Binataceae bacterium]
MKLRFPALNLKAKLLVIIVVLLAATLGAEVLISLRTQQAIAHATQENVKDLAGAIQISVEELTAVGSTDRELLQNYVRSLHNKGMEVSIASNQNLIINSSNPKLIGASLNPRSKQVVINEHLGADARRPASYDLVPMSRETTVYLIPVVVEDHLMGYIQVIANFGDYTELLRQARTRLITLALVIFAVGIVVSYALADRYTRPINVVASAAQNIAARGLEPVPEVRRRDEIGLLTRSFNEMVDQLRHVREREQELNRLERFTALGQLAGGLAHEIKNPLHFISLAVDQIRTRYAGQLSQEKDHFLRQIAMIKSEIHRLSGLIQNFLHYGKPIEIHTAPIDLRAMVHDVLALSESRLKTQGIEVIERDGEVPAVLNVDGEKIRTCFLNVVANATQAMPEGGTLKIGFERNNGALQVSFADNGVGIDPEVARHVFEPFFTTKREGIGIGLFLSKTIMEKHGGDIKIEPSSPPPGAVVTFSFPVNSARPQA